MNRRAFLKQSAMVSAGLMVGGIPKFARRAYGDDPTKWRTFEVTTKVEVTNPVGAIRVWLPVPLLNNTDYFKREPDTWTGNFKSARAVQYDKYGTGLLLAEWA
ncbi:MAG: transglutaminase, partial [Alphaproteobacteria bacterium]